MPPRRLVAATCLVAAAHALEQRVMPREDLKDTLRECLVTAFAPPAVRGGIARCVRVRTSGAAKAKLEQEMTHSSFKQHPIAPEIGIALRLLQVGGSADSDRVQIVLDEFPNRDEFPVSDGVQIVLEMPSVQAAALPPVLSVEDGTLSSPSRLAAAVCALRASGALYGFAQKDLGLAALARMRPDDIMVDDSAALAWVAEGAPPLNAPCALARVRLDGEDVPVPTNAMEAPTPSGFRVGQIIFALLTGMDTPAHLLLAGDADYDEKLAAAVAAGALTDCVMERRTVLALAITGVEVPGVVTAPLRGCLERRFSRDRGSVGLSRDDAAALADRRAAAFKLYTSLLSQVPTGVAHRVGQLYMSLVLTAAHMQTERPDQVVWEGSIANRVTRALAGAVVDHADVPAPLRVISDELDGALKSATYHSTGEGSDDELDKNYVEHRTWLESRSFEIEAVRVDDDRLAVLRRLAAQEGHLDGSSRIQELYVARDNKPAADLLGAPSLNAVSAVRLHESDTGPPNVDDQERQPGVHIAGFVRRRTLGVGRFGEVSLWTGVDTSGLPVEYPDFAFKTVVAAELTNSMVPLGEARGLNDRQVLIEWIASALEDADRECSVTRELRLADSGLLPCLGVLFPRSVSDEEMNSVKPLTKALDQATSPLLLAGVRAPTLLFPGLVDGFRADLVLGGSQWRKNELFPQLFAHIAGCLATRLGLLQSLGFVHRDVSFENVWVSADYLDGQVLEPPSTKQCVLFDFGSAAPLKQEWRNFYVPREHLTPAALAGSAMVAVSANARQQTDVQGLAIAVAQQLGVPGEVRAACGLDTETDDWRRAQLRPTGQLHEVSADHAVLNALGIYRAAAVTGEGLAALAHCRDPRSVPMCALLRGLAESAVLPTEEVKTVQSAQPPACRQLRADESMLALRGLAMWDGVLHEVADVLRAGGESAKPAEQLEAFGARLLRVVESGTAQALPRDQLADFSEQIPRRTDEDDRKTKTKQSLRKTALQAGADWAPKYTPAVVHNWSKFDLSSTISFLGQMGGPVGTLVVGLGRAPVSSLRWGRLLGTGQFGTVHQAVALDQNGDSVGTVAIKSVFRSLNTATAESGKYEAGRTWEQTASADVVEECSFTARAARDLRDGVLPCLAVLLPAASVRAFISSSLWDTGVPVFAVAGLDRPAAVMPVLQGMDAYRLFNTSVLDATPRDIPDWAAAPFQQAVETRIAGMWIGGIASCLGRAGAYLLDNKVVHRDATLSNIMVRPEFLLDPLHEGNCALIDFGLSSYWNDSQFSTRAVGAPTTVSPAMGYFMALGDHLERRAALDLYSMASSLLEASLRRNSLYSVCAFNRKSVYQVLIRDTSLYSQDKALVAARQLRVNWTADEVLAATFTPHKTQLCNRISDFIEAVKPGITATPRGVKEIESLKKRWDVLQLSGRRTLGVVMKMLTMTSPETDHDTHRSLLLQLQWA